MRPRSQDFEIVSTLGKGTYGACYQVRRKRDGAIFVVKVVSLEGLSAKERNETLNEARLMQQLRHKNVVRYIESWCEAECLYIVMEYYEAGDLGRVIKRHRGHVPEQEIWKYLIDIARGLGYVHERRILHRDVKPSNVFLHGDSAAIGDLGLGRFLGPNSALAYSQVGTPLYFSPELCEEQPYDFKSDVWAFGPCNIESAVVFSAFLDIPMKGEIIRALLERRCLMYELAAGLPPFIASNQIALAKKIVTDPPPSLPKNYSRELQNLIIATLEKKPSIRPSMQDILNHPSVSARIQIKEMEAKYKNLEDGLMREFQQRKKALQGDFERWKKQISMEFQQKFQTMQGAEVGMISKKDADALIWERKQADQEVRKLKNERIQLQKKLLVHESDIKRLQTTVARAEDEALCKNEELKQVHNQLKLETESAEFLRRQLHNEKESYRQLQELQETLQKENIKAMVNVSCQVPQQCENSWKVTEEAKSQDKEQLPQEGKPKESLLWLTPPYQSPDHDGWIPGQHSPSFVFPPTLDHERSGDGCREEIEPPESNDLTREFGSELTTSNWQVSDSPARHKGTTVDQRSTKHPTARNIFEHTINTRLWENLARLEEGEASAGVPLDGEEFASGVDGPDLAYIRSAPTTPYRAAAPSVDERQAATPPAPTMRHITTPHDPNPVSTSRYASRATQRADLPASRKLDLESEVDKRKHAGGSVALYMPRTTHGHDGGSAGTSNREIWGCGGVRGGLRGKAHTVALEALGLKLGWGAANQGRSSGLMCLLHWRKAASGPVGQKSKSVVYQPIWGSKERYSVPSGGGNHLGVLYRTNGNSKEKPVVKKMWARLRATTRFEKMDLTLSQKCQGRQGQPTWIFVQARWMASVGSSRDVAEVMIEFGAQHAVDELLIVKYDESLRRLVDVSAHAKGSRPPLPSGADYRDLASGRKATANGMEIGEPTLRKDALIPNVEGRSAPCEVKRNALPLYIEETEETKRNAVITPENELSDSSRSLLSTTGSKSVVSPHTPRLIAVGHDPETRERTSCPPDRYSDVDEAGRVGPLDRNFVGGNVLAAVEEELGSSDGEDAPLMDSLTWPLKPHQVQQLQRHVKRTEDGQSEAKGVHGELSKPSIPSQQRVLDIHTHGNAFVDTRGSDRAGSGGKSSGHSESGKARNTDVGLVMENLSRALATVESKLNARGVGTRTQYEQKPTNVRGEELLSRPTRQWITEPPSPCATTDVQQAPVPFLNHGKSPVARFREPSLLQPSDTFMMPIEHTRVGVAATASPPPSARRQERNCRHNRLDYPANQERLCKEAEDLQDQLDAACKLLRSPLK